MALKPRLLLLLMAALFAVGVMNLALAVNHKLTTVIKGRVLIGSEADLSSLRLTFKDGSTMKVKTADYCLRGFPKEFRYARSRSTAQSSLSAVKTTPLST